MAVSHPSPPSSDLAVLPSRRWGRGTLDGATVLDRRRALLVWAPGWTVPGCAFPRDDVALGFPRTGAVLAVRESEDPDLTGYVSLAGDAPDHWYEDEEMFVHPRDPFGRVDAIHSSRHVPVERDGRLLAGFERADPCLRDRSADSLLPAGQRRRLGRACGQRSPHRVPVRGRSRPTRRGRRRAPVSNLFWYHPNPLRESAELEGYLAPYGERVDLIVDDELQTRPVDSLAAHTHRH